MLPALAMAAAFNMLCSGTETFSIGPSERPYETVYRIDLEHGRWCEGDCESVRAIARIVGDRIVLHDGTPPSRATGRRRIDAGLTEKIEIDRSTGSYFSEYVNSVPVIVIRTTQHGTCREVDFTGFTEVGTSTGD